jgi:predicted dehydrogenase
MRRRHFLATTGAAALPLRALPTYKVGVIGHTDRGNYGHGIGDVWPAFPQARVVAVSDPDPEGRAVAKERTGAPRAYADYRELLAKEEPDIVSICPRHTDQRLPMVTAAAAAGCHMYLEKPFAGTLTDADLMVAAVREAGVKVQIAHQMRRSPFTIKALELIESGEIGEVHEVRGRGKEDFRAGGEDLVVLGSHIFDMMRAVLGDPEWVFAHITSSGEELGFDHLRKPNEPIGPVAGREMAAMFSFGAGRHGYFATKKSSLTHPWRFGTHVYGARGRIFLPNQIYSAKSEGFILRSPAWIPGTGREWERIEPDHRSFGEQRNLTANALMVEDLLDAIESDREPACSERAGRWTVEMTQGMYASQLGRAAMDFPLENRNHPLEALRDDGRQGA